MTETMEPEIVQQFERGLPNSPEAEICLLASMMLDKGVRTECLSMICRDDFFSTDYQIIFDVMASLAQREKPIDAVIVFEELVKRQLLEEIGGKGVIAQILGAVPSSAHGTHYAGIVKEKSVLRGVIDAANKMLQAAYAPMLGDAAEKIIDTASMRLAELASAGSRANSTKQLRDILPTVRERLASIDDLDLIQTGLAPLDQIIGGIGKGEMWLLAGRPSMGKSLASKQIARNVAKEGIGVAVFAREERAIGVAGNIWSSEAYVENRKIRVPRELADRDWDKLEAAQKRLHELPIFINDKLKTLAEIRSETASLVARKGVQLVIVDHIGKVQAGGRTDYERASLASNGIADMIHDLGVAGLIPVQLNRSIEGERKRGTNARPSLSDLRSTGELEQDADGVLLLHREDYYRINEPGYAPDHEVEINVAKMRGGERGAVARLHALLPFLTFADQSETPQLWEKP
jgi:replicative DNA helicase